MWSFWAAQQAGGFLLSESGSGEDQRTGVKLGARGWTGKE